MPDPDTSPTTLTTLDVHALTPLLFREARPFGNTGDETRARSLPMPLPSTTAGFVRSLVGDALGWNWSDPATIEKAKAIAVHGALLVRRLAEGPEEVVLTAPRDAVVYKDEADVARTMRLFPAPPAEGAGCDLPDDGLWPLSITADAKPERGYGLWTWTDVMAWLQHGRMDAGFLPTRIADLSVDERVHVALDPERQTAQEGMLFTVEYRSFDQVLHDKEEGTRTPVHWHLRVLAALSGVKNLPERLTSHLGGERRPVTVQVRAHQPAWPVPPETLLKALTGTTRVTLTLATPALFKDGWRPAWLNSGKTSGTLPDNLRPLAGSVLRSAAVGRAEPVSGWAYEAAQRGPKATRLMAPAGSVYFLELARILTREEVLALWMTSVSDLQAESQDGYGLALWGVWE